MDDISEREAIAPTASTGNATFDISAFLEATAVKNLARRTHNIVRIVDVPETNVPSPLAANIAPGQVERLREVLVREGGKRGREKWEAWKRAWDLWNGWYIEGRVSATWIKEEYKSLKNVMEGERRVIAGNDIIPPQKKVVGGVEVDSDYQSSEDDDDDLPDYVDEEEDERERMIEKGTARQDSDEGVFESGRKEREKGDTTVWAREEPSSRKGTVFRKILGKERARVENVEEKLKRSRLVKTGRRELIKRVRQVPGQGKVHVEQGNRVKLFERKGKNMVATGKTRVLTEDEIVEGQQTEIFEEEVSEVEVVEEEVSGEGESWIEYEWEEVDAKATSKTGDNGNTSWVGHTHMRGGDGDAVIPQLDVFDAEQETSGESDEDDNEGEGDDPPAKPPGHIMDSPLNELYGTEESENEETSVQSRQASRKALRELSDGPIPFPPAKHVRAKDGSSGGFKAMKDLPEYKDAGENVGGPKREDALQNSVWRPKDVGESEGKPNILIDRKFGSKSNPDLEVDGGVDCGRSPYPCLRSVAEYFLKRDADGDADSDSYAEKTYLGYLKKKKWDEVTGTIFNMPISNRERSERELDMEARFGDWIRDQSDAPRNGSVFPLDIRRARNMKYKKVEIPLVGADEEENGWPWYNPGKPYPHLKKDDPWWVTKDQKYKRDIPPRRYPTFQADNGKQDLIYIDDTLWRKEYEADVAEEEMYFATNLHGGLLIINGQEVKKGQVAGPLPKFAVIETEGGQISFWWGVDGKNYGQELELDRLTELDWERLRKQGGDFENIALTPGQVWTVRIKDRLRRERSGDDENDDDVWAKWKRGQSTEKQAHTDNSASGSGGSRPESPEYGVWRGERCEGKEIHNPESFYNEQDELKWLYTRAEPMWDIAQAPIPVLIEPAPNESWPGPGSFAVDTPWIAAQKEREQSWNIISEELVEAQRSLTIQLQEEKEKWGSIQEAELENIATARREEIQAARKKIIGNSGQKEILEQKQKELTQKRNELDRLKKKTEGATPKKRNPDVLGELPGPPNKKPKIPAPLELLSPSRSKDLSYYYEITKAQFYDKLEDETRGKDPVAAGLARGRLVKNYWRVLEEDEIQLAIENAERKRRGQSPLSSAELVAKHAFAIELGKPGTDQFRIMQTKFLDERQTAKGIWKRPLRNDSSENKGGPPGKKPKSAEKESHIHHKSLQAMINKWPESKYLNSKVSVVQPHPPSISRNPISGVSVKCQKQSIPEEKQGMEGEETIKEYSKGQGRSSKPTGWKNARELDADGNITRKSLLRTLEALRRDQTREEWLEEHEYTDIKDFLERNKKSVDHDYDAEVVYHGEPLHEDPEKNKDMKTKLHRLRREMLEAAKVGLARCAASWEISEDEAARRKGYVDKDDFLKAKIWEIPATCVQSGEKSNLEWKKACEDITAAEEWGLLLEEQKAGSLLKPFHVSPKSKRRFAEV